jgi:hypothetical protein
VIDPADLSEIPGVRTRRNERTPDVYARRLALAAGVLCLDEESAPAVEESSLPFDCQLQHPLADLLKSWEFGVQRR